MGIYYEEVHLNNTSMENIKYGLTWITGRIHWKNKQKTFHSPSYCLDVSKKSNIITIKIVECRELLKNTSIHSTYLQQGIFIIVNIQLIIATKKCWGNLHHRARAVNMTTWRCTPKHGLRFHRFVKLKSRWAGGENIKRFTVFYSSYLYEVQSEILLKISISRERYLLCVCTLLQQLSHVNYILHNKILSI